MSFMFSLFRTQKHRVFNYQPLYYDERKEALDEKLEKARKKETGEYVPGEHLRGAFRRGKIELKRSNKHDSVRRFATLIALVLFMVALVYIAQYMGLFFNF